MKTLHLDLETFSDVNLSKSGAYKYINSLAFQILLVGYSADGGPVQVIDMAQGELFPRRLADALVDPGCIKHAWNAQFEWACLSRLLGQLLPEDQWRCTMLQAQYLSYPASLAAAGQALGMPEDKQKLTSGRYLIKYFCEPCAPTKANGGRTRNRPNPLDMARWDMFKEYCKGDVLAEMEAARRMAGFPVPDAVQKQWETDLVINSRGVNVDMDLVHGAIEIGAGVRARLMDEAARLSGLNNPNSVAQLTQWLELETDEVISDLRQDTVQKLLDGNAGNEAVTRMLEIRRELSKTSTKKYDSIAAVVSHRGRCRGLLQFYGASKTGRWSGRLIQTQNMPRTYIEQLDLARDWIKRRDTEVLQMLFGGVPDALSQLIRTAFIASPGCVLICADYAAIEARIIAWLAGEHWRLEVFRTHGKIYEASASQMFGVPIDLIKKGNPEYELRQRGKVAELGLGYGMGADRLKAFAEQIGVQFTPEEAREIVNRWRDTNKSICELWYGMEAAAVAVIQNGASVGVKNIVFARECNAEKLDFLTIRLPSGRKLYYAKPHLTSGHGGKPSISYTGVNQTSRKWGTIRTYGASIVENVVQAIARDVLAEAVERLETARYATVMHAHDEVVLDVPRERADLNKVIDVMTAPMPWAADLPLKADGYISEFYRKG